MQICEWIKEKVLPKIWEYEKTLHVLKKDERGQSALGWINDFGDSLNSLDNGIQT